MRIALNEIIWEITGACHNGCTYCGSSGGWQEEVDERAINVIAKKIAAFPPKELDVSGGDPLLVPIELHREIIKILSDKTRCKILFNPKSLKSNREEKLEILKLYSYVGISVNTEEEIELFKSIESFLSVIPYTIITNFNLTNSYLVDLLVSDVVKDKPWQIQFSVVSKDIALYNYPLAVKRLNDDLGKYPKLKLIIADNGNQGLCSAGISSIGILSDGTVVPCLSMRSWVSEEELYASKQGCLLEDHDLKTIWTTQFQKQRFDSFKCCKDVCDHQIIFPVFGKGENQKDLPTGPVYGVSEGQTPPWQPLQQETCFYMVKTYPLQQLPTIRPWEDVSVQAYAVSSKPFDFLTGTSAGATITISEALTKLEQRKKGRE